MTRESSMHKGTRAGANAGDTSGSEWGPSYSRKQQYGQEILTKGQAITWGQTGGYRRGRHRGQADRRPGDDRLSKKMTNILRHRAGQFGLKLREDGFLQVYRMLEAGRGRYFEEWTEEDVVEYIVPAVLTNQSG